MADHKLLRQIDSVLGAYGLGTPTQLTLDYKALPTAQFLQPEDSLLSKVIEDEDKAFLMARPLSQSASGQEYRVSVSLGTARNNKQNNVHNFYKFLLKNPSAVALSGDDYFLALDGANFWSHQKAFSQVSFWESKWVGNQHEISLQRNTLNAQGSHSLFIKYNPLSDRGNYVGDLLKMIDGSHINHTVSKVYPLGIKA